VFAHGIPDDEALVIAEKLLRGDDLSTGAFVTEVASSKHIYGRLAAIDLFGFTSAVEVPVLQAYAEIAATALDSAMAIEDARRQAASARALLSLATQLAELQTSQEMAERIVVTTSLVIDCDPAAILVLDQEQVKILSVHGLSEATQHDLGRLDWTDRHALANFAMHCLDDPLVAAPLALAGMVAAATTPIVIEGCVAGYLAVGIKNEPDRLRQNLQLEEQMRGLAGQASSALRNARLLDQVRHQAMHDPLTGLPNRVLLMDRAESLLSKARRGAPAVAALFIDLDGFKQVNDTFGHAAGDSLLRAVADRLGSLTRESDTLARLGGDEFIVLTDGTGVNGGAEVVGRRLLDSFREPFDLDETFEPVRVGASIGIAVGRQQTTTELLRQADAALYAAKAKGTGHLVRFDPELSGATAGAGVYAEGH
jgi:diguanylate cyclase (GGDEF)-like protein